MVWAGRQPLVEGTAVEDGLDGGLGHQEGLGAPFGDAPLGGVGAVVGGQDEAEEHDRQGGDGRVGDEEPRQRARPGRRRRHKREFRNF